jgi:hypothetical protein
MGRYTEYTMLKKSRDHVEKSTIAASDLKNFAGDTQNINLWEWAIAMHGSYESKFVTSTF